MPTATVDVAFLCDCHHDVGGVSRIEYQCPACGGVERSFPGYMELMLALPGERVLLWCERCCTGFEVTPPAPQPSGPAQVRAPARGYLFEWEVRSY